MDCAYCGGGNDYRMRHPACHLEYWKRVRGGRCTRCGIGEAAGPRDSWCGACRKTGNPQFVGYPPGVK